MTDKTQLGDRMKAYENIPRIHLTPRMPAICRIDGKAFHTFTKGFPKPWSTEIRDAMTAAAKALVDEIQGAELAYYQSDEISVLLNDYKRFTSQAWFDKNVQKMAAVSASIATAHFNSYFALSSVSKLAEFDSRCFVLPREEVNNYFWWRQMDAIRNSVSGLAQANFSHKELQGKSVAKMKEMLLEKGIDWDECEPWQKFGMYVNKGEGLTVGGAMTFKFKDNPDFVNACLVQLEE